MKKLVLLIMLCGMLTACPQTARLDVSKDPSTVEVPGVGTFKCYELNRGFTEGTHYIYVREDQPTTINYRQGKTNSTIVVVDGVEYIPKK